MTYHLSWWLLAAVVVYIIIAIVAYEAYRETAKTRLARIVITAIGLVIALLINLGVYVATGTIAARDVYAVKAAAMFGLESGKPYPLSLGARTGSSSGYFTARDGSIQPSSIVAVDFTHNGNSYILELPLAKVVFAQREDVVPSVTLVINNGTTPYGTEHPTSTPCLVVIEGGFLTCQNTWRFTTTLDPEVERQGLNPIVRDHLSSASIILPPASYQAILGKNG